MSADISGGVGSVSPTMTVTTSRGESLPASVPSTGRGARQSVLAAGTPTTPWPRFGQLTPS